MLALGEDNFELHFVCSRFQISDLQIFLWCTVLVYTFLRIFGCSSSAAGGCSAPNIASKAFSSDVHTFTSNKAKASAHQLSGFLSSSIHTRRLLAGLDPMKPFTMFIAILNLQRPLPARGFAPSLRVLHRTHSVSIRPEDVYDIEPKRDPKKQPKKGFFESINPLNLFKPKEKPKSDMERFIDDQFEGTGPMGAFLGAGLKGIGRTMEKSMEDAMKDVTDVANEVERALSADG